MFLPCAWMVRGLSKWANTVGFGGLVCGLYGDTKSMFLPRRGCGSPGLSAANGAGKRQLRAGYTVCV